MTIETTELMSSSADVELRRNGTTLTLYFCDAQGSQWEDEIGEIGDFSTKEDLAEELESYIKDAVEDFAKSIVENSLKRSGMLPELVVDELKTDG